jgi:ATP-dependent helicase/nuclease subunit A
VSDPRRTRELIRASAGTGKTYQISSHIIGLLAAGVEPERILASTFTRKAAGEILERVLLRLAEAALEGEKARVLGKEIAGEASGDDAPWDPERASALLERLVRALHRIDVGTLDAFFVRLARSFGPELGLPLTWRIAEAGEQEEARSEAVQEVLEAGDHDRLLELLRMIARGDHDRRVHDRLVEDVDELQELLREMDPAAAEPWSPFAMREPVDDPERARSELAGRLEELELPTNKDGRPNGPWEGALRTAVEAIRGGTWEELWKRGFAAAWLEGRSTFSRKPFPAALPPLLEEARRLTAAQLAPELDGRARAMGEIARLYDAALSRLQERTGGYRFGDVAHLLGPPSPLAARPDLRYRLDRRSEHLLLDEFQDTSLVQWQALAPLADEIEKRGALVVVADPKQSIYGWRNADPDLVERVRDRYDLPTRSLVQSWRSGPAVLEFVNRLFGTIAANPVLQAFEGGRKAAEAWGATFEPHEPAPPRRMDAGRVTVEVGPDDHAKGDDRPRLVAHAATRVVELHGRLPGAEIGVLVSRNATVARFIHELRLRGVEASEEGGTPVDDAAPVSAVLALLRTADHPGDTLARYPVARSPLGPVVSYEDYGDEDAARRLAARVRRRLLREGYGGALTAWTEALAPLVDAAELRRMEQLVELGFRWDEHATLRPGDFIHFVQTHRVEDPLSAPVRVMTVHQAKGLEFDVVVLPELDLGLHRRSGDAAVPERDPATGRILRVFPSMSAKLRPLFPEAEEAWRQLEASHLRDRLSWLYVAVTRARHALHLVIAADEGERLRGERSYARLVRAMLDRHEGPVRAGETLLEIGDPHWYRSVPGMEERPTALSAVEPRVRIDTRAPRTRILARRTPSGLEGEGRIDLAQLLGLEAEASRAAGKLVHAWCERIGWIEEGVPGPGVLADVARERAPALAGPEAERLAERFVQWLGNEEVRRALSRVDAAARLARLAGEEGAPAGALPELHRERRFARRTDGEVVTGVIDRLVLLRAPADGQKRPGRVVAAEVLDFKTDEVADFAALEARAAVYDPQLEAYRDAVAGLYGLEPARVGGGLLFLAAGRLVEGSP